MHTLQSFLHPVHALGDGCQSCNEQLVIVILRSRAAWWGVIYALGVSMCVCVPRVCTDWSLEVSLSEPAAGSMVHNSATRRSMAGFSAMSPEATTTTRRVNERGVLLQRGHYELNTTQYLALWLLGT